MPLPVQGSTSSGRSTPSIFATPSEVVRPVLADSMLQYITVGASKPNVLPPMTENVNKVLMAFRPSYKHLDAMYVTPEMADGTRYELDYLTETASLRSYTKDGKLYSMTPLPEGAKVTIYIKSFLEDKNLLSTWDAWSYKYDKEEDRRSAFYRIKYCIEHQSATLELSGLKLSSIPLRLPSHITTLDISNNKLTSLPNLPPNLCHLNAGRNRLLSLPTVYPPSLVTIKVNNNDLKSLPVFPVTLREINVSWNKLTQFQGLPRMLTSLNVGNNPHRIDKTPNFSVFSKLQTLIIDGLGLKKLPPVPSTLQTLFLQNNPLCAIPALTGLKQLHHLNISNTQITKIPHLPATVTELHADDNKISSLPLFPAGLGVLSLNKNRLTVFQANLYPQIFDISLNDNQITHIYGPLSENLKIMNISNNQLSEFPPLRSRVDRLDISHNRIIFVPRFLPSTSLVFVDHDNIYNSQLRRIRKEKELTEKQLADILQVKELEIKRTEDVGDDAKLDMVKRYVNAMGGTVSLRFKLPTGEYHVIKI